MIRNLFDIENLPEDEDSGDKKPKDQKPPRVQEMVSSEESATSEDVKALPADEIMARFHEDAGPAAELDDDEVLLELEEAARQIETDVRDEESVLIGEPDPLDDISTERLDRLDAAVSEVQAELLEEKSAEVSSESDPADSHPVAAREDSQLFGSSTLLSDTVPSESRAETFRKSGMAYSAALALLGAVVFMMIIGWGADLILGTKPWGIVVGVIIGAAIGFIQLFRVSSQIFKN